MKQKEKSSPTKDASDSTFSEENIARSNSHMDQSVESADADDNIDSKSGSGNGEALKQKDLDAEEPE
jgi:hypothetical protein